MQENFLHLLSLCPCSLQINGQDIGYIDNKNVLELDLITKTEKLFVNYTPITYKKNIIPFSFELDTANYPTTENEYIKIIPFPNNNYDIIMKPFYYYQLENSNVIFNQNVGKYFISILSENSTKITIFSGASIVFTINTVLLKSAKAELKKDILIIEGIIDSDNYYLLVIDTSDFSILHNDIVQSIENTDSYIQSLKNLHDISHHAFVCKIEFANKNKQYYHVYENNISCEPLSPYLIPQDFLECLISNDEPKAKKHLDNKFNNSNIAQFKNYFGEIKEIYLNRHNVLQDKLNYTIKSETYKNYNFIMKNNKIFEIEEIF